jgi:hypothetical protein
MKRSEMEYKISEHILQNEGVYINAPRLLKMLEREGMKPPDYIVEERISETYKKIHIYSGRWEPEDEKK